MAGILWLASYPKSGNTWVRAFLATYFRNPDQPLSINELYTFAYGDNFLTYYEDAAGKPADALTPEEIRRLRPVVHGMFAGHPEQTSFVKTHTMIADDAGTPTITPDATAGAIYVVRNPLDVAVSFAHHFQNSYDTAVETLCTPGKILPGQPGLKLPELMGAWWQHVRAWTDAPGLTRHVMRYEDMLAEPGPTFRKLVKFMGLPVEARRLSRAVRFTSFESLASQEHQEGFNEARPDRAVNFFRRGRRSQWREALTDEQVQRILAANGETMRAFGYLDRTGDPV